jgi:hypothetical protein
MKIREMGQYFGALYVMDNLGREMDAVEADAGCANREDFPIRPRRKTARRLRFFCRLPGELTVYDL